MGVPGLHAALGPYARSVTRRQAPAPPGSRAPEPNLVVDGPALAYHVYNQLVARGAGSATHPLHAIPSYQQIAAETVRFLALLEAYALVPKHVFFDGRLPDAKTNVRLGRLQKCQDQMRSLRLLHPHLGSAGAASTEPARARIKAIPAAPFLVPAAVEGLRRSKYASITKLVPCEADLSCTDPACCLTTDYILTSDSDLVLQNPPGSIIFFNSLQTVTAADESQSLMFDYFDTADIAARASLAPDKLVLMGYHLHSQASSSILEAAKIATTSPPAVADSASFRHFRALYRPWASPSRWDEHPLFVPRSDCRSPVLEALEQLDARIAEYIIQSHIFSSPSSSSSSPSSPTPIYLPFLLDDSSRASAWKPSLPIRTLAYSIWQTPHPHPDTLPSTVAEYHRRGLKIEPHNLTLLNQPDQKDALDSLLANLTSWHAQLQTSDPPTKWTAIALLLHIHSESRHDDPKLPDPQDILQLLSAEKHAATWSQLHLSAQLDGVVYSLRILKQILHLARRIRDDDNNKSLRDNRLNDASVDNLEEILSTMPELSALLLSPGACTHLVAVSDNLLDLLRPVYGNLREAQTQDKPTKSRRKKNASKGGPNRRTAPAAAARGRLSQNIYAALARDG